MKELADVEAISIRLISPGKFYTRESQKKKTPPAAGIFLLSQPT
jgi:hypothetical protein